MVAANVCAELVCQSLPEMLSVVIVVPVIPSPSRSQLLSFFSGIKTRLNAVKTSGINVWADIFRNACFVSIHWNVSLQNHRLTVKCFQMGNFLGLLGMSVIFLGSFGPLTINPSCSLWAWQHSHGVLKPSSRDLCFVGSTNETYEKLRH